MTSAPLDRKSAREIGSLFYYPARPCKYGHPARRYAKSGGCVVCAAKRGRVKYKRPTGLARITKKRRDLVSQGEKHFESQTPCKNGHVGLRYLKSGDCVSCATIRTKWRVETGHAKDVQARYNATHPETRRKSSKAYRERNLEACKARLKLAL